MSPAVENRRDLLCVPDFFFIYFLTKPVNRDYNVEGRDDIVNELKMIWKEGIVAKTCNIRAIFWRYRRRPRNMGRDSRWPGRHANQASPEYIAPAWPLHQPDM